MTIGERIRYLREKNGMSQTTLAEKSGISKQSLYKYEMGIITNIPSDKIEVIAKMLSTTPSYLMGWDDKKPFDDQILSLPNIFPIKLKKFRLLGNIACGEPIFADEDHETYIEAASNIKADFCLRANGDSMIGARINDGDVVFIRQQSIVENGEIAAVIINDEATLKRWYYYPEKQKLMLVAENPKYEPLVYMGEELNEIRCLGKAVCFMSNLL